MKPEGVGFRQHKYRAQRTSCGQGHNHPSKAEAKRCDELKLLERAGEIRCLEYGPRYFFHLNGDPIKHDNGRRLVYTPDWRYFEGDKCIAEECKGFITADYKVRLALFKAFFPHVEHRVTGR